MKSHCVVLAATAVVLAASSAAGQPQTTPATVTLSKGLQDGYAAIKRNLTLAADKLSEADYSFRPTPQVRSYGQLFGHVANGNYRFCAAAKGERNPNQGNDFEKKTTKAEFVRALADAFAYCDTAFASLTEETAMRIVTLDNTPINLAILLANRVIAHDNEMYGTSVVYMRLKGVVPPSTEDRNRP